MDLTAYVQRDIVDLLSAFLPNRHAEIGQLRQALWDGDWARLHHLAERMYALGNPYGFRHITTLGRCLREACAAKDALAIQRLIQEYDIYLSKVTIVEVDASPGALLTANAREALLAMGEASLQQAAPVAQARER